MDAGIENVFLINSGTFDEQYDIGKFIEFKGDVYDVLVSPFLDGIKKLPVWRYYKVEDGEKDIDLISFDVYGTLFYGWIIQYYNDTTEEVFKEGDILNLFNESDLEELYKNISNGNLEQIS